MQVDILREVTIQWFHLVGIREERKYLSNREKGKSTEINNRLKSDKMEEGKWRFTKIKPRLITLFQSSNRYYLKTSILLSNNLLNQYMVA